MSNLADLKNVVEYKIVNTIKDLLDVTPKFDGYGVRALGYHEPNDGGGGVFYWDANQDKANHNGGTIIDPTKEFPSDWSDTTQQDTWFNTTNTGNGCWMKIYDNYVIPEWFGAKGDGVTDDTKALQQAINFINNIIITKKYAISSTIYAPVDVMIKGISNKQSQIILTGTDTDYNVGAILINTNDGSTWIEEYPNIKTGGVFNLRFSVYGVVVAGSGQFEDLTFEKFAKSIKIAGYYSDLVTIRRVHCPFPLNTDDYQIEAAGLGDGYIIEQVHILPNSDGTLKNGIHLAACEGGRISECLGGNIFIDICYPVTIENIHFEGTTITVNSSNIAIKNSHLWATNEPVIKFENSKGGRYRAKLEDIYFVYDRTKPSSNYIDNDIQIASGYIIEFNGVFRRKSSTVAISESDLMGVNLTDGSSNVTEYNNVSYIASLESVFDTDSKKVFNIQNIECGTGLLYTGTYSNTYPGITWEDASGTYYFQYALIYDPVRMIGVPNSNPEKSFTLTQNGDGINHVIGYSQRGDKGFLRIYKGTSSGTYDQYVDIPIVKLSYVVDNGIRANGFSYKARTSSGVDSFNTNISEIIKWNKDGTIVCRGSGTPTVGTWQSGDIIYNISPSVDSNNMVLLGWIFDGTNWQPMYVSTVSPAT